MSESDRDKSTQPDVDSDNTNLSDGMDEESGSQHDSDVTQLSQSLLASLDSLDSVVQNANATITDESAYSQYAQQDTNNEDVNSSADDQVYMILSQLKQDISDMRQEQDYYSASGSWQPAEATVAGLNSSIYDTRGESPLPMTENDAQLQAMLNELRRDIDGIRNEQGMTHLGGAEGQLYNVLNEMQRDIGNLRREQGRDQLFDSRDNGLTLLNMSKLAVMGVVAGLTVVVLENLANRASSREGVMTVSPDSFRTFEKMSRSAPTVRTKLARDVVGLSGTPISLDIDLGNLPITPGTVVKFSQLPDSAVLSSGSRKGKEWVAPADRIKGVTMLLPRDFSGYINARIEVLDNRRKVIRSDRFRATIVASSEQPATKPVVRSQPLQVDKPELGSAEENDLIANANTLLDQGDIVGARRVLDFAVSQGSVSAAVALAKTFDPKTVNEMTNLFGVEPDLTRAKVLYYFAARKGNKEAAKRLAEISEEQK